MDRLVGALASIFCCDALSVPYFAQHCKPSVAFPLGPTSCSHSSSISMSSATHQDERGYGRPCPLCGSPGESSDRD